MSNRNLIETIPLTKLSPPQLAGGTLHRPHLRQSLYHAVTSRRLTLLAAPAGAGKTTAVVDLHAAYPELPLAWVALDEGDDDPHIFLQLLIAAVQKEVAEYGRYVQQILEGRSENRPDWRRLMGALVNDMATHITAPFLIVLDDLHRVSDKTIHQLLDYLLERMPSHIHLLITTRHDPPLHLAQLRARGEMVEFRLDALRFSPEEVAALFNKILDFNLTPADLQLIQDRTEGWAAGVRLFTLSLPRMESAGTRADFVQHLASSQRFLFDYLIEEVLDRLDADDRDFLLQTSILDELTATLCNAVTGRNDAAVTLDALYRQNLFLVISETADPLAEPVYRTHALFAQFLQKQLRQQPEFNVATLHLRAAGAETSPKRRIQHLLAAEAWDEAAAAIIAIGKIQCDHQLVQPQVIEWIGRLPTHVRQRHYWLDLIEASYLGQKGHLSQAWRICKAILPRAQAQGDVVGELEALWTLSFFIAEQSETEWRRRFSELIASWGDLVSPARRAAYLIGQAWDGLNRYDWPPAQQHFYDYIHAVRAAEDPQLYRATSQYIGPQWLFVDNGLSLIHQFDRGMLQIFGDGDGLLQAGPYMRQGWIALLQGDLTTAEEMSRRVGHIIHLMGSLAWVDLTIDWILLGVMVARSDFARLEAFVQEAESRLQQVETHRQNLNHYWFALWRAYWLQNRWEDAYPLIAKFVTTLDERDVAESPTIAILEGWQAHANGQTLLAEERLLEAARRHRRFRWIGTWGNAGVDLALFYLLENRPQEALAAWSEAAAEMQKRVMPGQPLFTGRKVIPLLKLAVEKNIYAEIAQVSLDAFGEAAAPQPLPIPNSEEWLTPREVEVLQLLMAGATNQEIADQLIVTVRTAKAHVSNILQKLNVSTRTEAVARAHELSLSR